MAEEILIKPHAAERSPAPVSPNAHPEVMNQMKPPICTAARNNLRQLHLTNPKEFMME